MKMAAEIQRPWGSWGSGSGSCWACWGRAWAWSLSIFIHLIVNTHTEKITGNFGRSNVEK